MRLGNTGLRVSRICFGTMTYGTPQWRPWTLDEDAARPFYKQAFELGINFVDTADMYSLGVSEEITGRAIRDFAKRDDIVLATKVYNRMGEGPNDWGLSRKHIMNAIDASLRRLGTDYVDLYQIHRWDYETPIAETLEALNDVVRAGKARYIGASSMWAWQLAQALYVADLHSWSRIVSMQNHYNLIYREEEREMLPLCRAEGIAVNPWSAVARGFLAGNRTRDKSGETFRSRNDPYAYELYYREADFEIADRVVQLATRRGVKPIQIALAWVLNQPGVTAPVLGFTKPHHLEEAAAALDIRLSPEECAFLQELYRPRPIAGHE